MPRLLDSGPCVVCKAYGQGEIRLTLLPPQRVQGSPSYHIDLVDRDRVKSILAVASPSDVEISMVGRRRLVVWKIDASPRTAGSFAGFHSGSWRCGEQ